MVERVAILSFHSHGDRSFLDDRELALASGDLTRAAVPNDLLAVRLPDGADAPPEELVRALTDYDVVVYERVWSEALVRELRARLPGRTFVACEGEHRLAAPPADVECRGELRRALPALIRWLDGAGDAPPGTRRRTERGWRTVAPTAPLQNGALPWEPNLRPLVLDLGGPGGAPQDASRTPISVVGNAGCPYQADARDNPAYAGARLPEGMGRGCAFCTTGNRYEPAAPAETAARVLEKLRYLARHAPQRRRVVLKDQNPFAWLPELVRRIGADGLASEAPLTLLLETRVDWFLRSGPRFERALAAAPAASVVLAPYLIGVESFSQAELDRFNKGVDAADNVAFLEQIARWEAAHPEAFDLSHASFGFVLFTPWTTLEDLAINHRKIVATGFDRYRGSLLLSRARLYPDTALYWLAERDGLLAERWPHAGADSAARYGYFPGHPWRFADPVVARLSALATALSERSGGRDQPRLLGALLRAFAADPHASADDVRAALAEGRPPPSPSRALLRARLAALLRPVPLEGPFAGGWRVAEWSARPGRVRLRLSRDGAPAEGFEIDLVPRSGSGAYARSRHYDLRFVGRALPPEAAPALDAIARAVRHNDR